MSDTQAIAADAAPVVPALNIPTDANEQAVAPSKDAPDQAGPEATTEGDSNDETKQEKPRQKASERIGELYGRMKTAERERDQAIAEVQRLRQPSVSREQFEQLSYDEQQRAIVKDTIRQERAEQMELEASRRHQESMFLRAQQYNDRVTAAAETIPDLIEKLSDPSLPVSEYAAQIIGESEKGPQVAYWLANNRQEALRIARLSPTQQAYELGKIEARINAAPTARKVSKAPAPVPTVGGGAGAGGKDPSAMSMSEYIAWRKTASA